MKKHIALIIFIGLALFMLPAIAFGEQTDSFSFNLTDGTPVGTPETVLYRGWNPNPDNTQETIHNFTRQHLDNENSRYTLEFTMPEDLFIIVGSGYGDQKEAYYISARENKITSPNRSILQFDFKDTDWESVEGFYVYFYSSNGYGKQLTVQKTSSSINYNKTNGNPVGDIEEVNYGWWSGCDTTLGTIHSFTRQSLDNEHTRFTVEYTMPAGFNISVFNPPNGDIIKYYNHLIATTAERSTLCFDVLNTDLDNISSISIRFDAGDSYTGISTNLARKSSSFHFNPTNGNPDGEQINAKYTTDNYLDQKYPDAIFHSFTRQSLDNDYTRFTLEYTVPEGCNVYVRIYNESDILDTYSSDSLKRFTSSERSILQLDVSNEELEEIITTINIHFSSSEGAIKRLTARFPRETSFFEFNKTNGTPVGEQQDVNYTTDYSLDQKHPEAIFHSFTRQSLDNDYTRFTLEYTVPEGLEIVARINKGTNNWINYSSLSQNTVTSSERSRLQLDLSNEELENVITKIRIDLYDSSEWVKTLSFTLPRETSSFEINKTNGTPIGEQKEIPYTIYHPNPEDPQGSFYRFTSQNLDNDYTRLTLEYEVPAGLYIGISPYNQDGLVDDYYTKWNGMCTSSERSTLQYDIKNTVFNSITRLNVTFLDNDNNVIVQLRYSYDLENMSVLYLPNSLEKIEDEAFEGLSCEAVIVPNCCTSIGNYAFRNCRKLKYIRVPANIEIAPTAFEGCGNVWIERVQSE